MTTESERWERYSDKVEDILYYFFGFFHMRNNGNEFGIITECCVENLKCAVRLVSWVESKHGEVGPNHPARDPMQTGNPDDAWWKEFTGQSGRGGRFLGGPGADNFWANKLCEAFIADLEARIKRLQADSDRLIRGPGNLPPDRFFEVLKFNRRYIEMYSHWLEKIQWTCSEEAREQGHRSEEFEPCMSFFWGILYVLYQLREGRWFYKINCHNCESLIEALEGYNGGGDPEYLNKLREAHEEIDCCEDC